MLKLGEPGQHSRAAMRQSTVESWIEQRWRFAKPRLRMDWAHRHENTAGRVTRQETLWTVIVTMGVAASRDNILHERGIQWYFLHFYVLWSILIAAGAA